jgi:hypothetical protein
MWLFSIMRIVNLPVFTFPGLACMYNGISYYNMVLVYFFFPIAACMFIYVMYQLILRKLPSRYVGVCPHQAGLTGHSAQMGLLRVIGVRL